MIETGLPRTDLLLGPDREGVAVEVKRRLGVEGKRVVLYAPTYRDHLDYRPGRRPGVAATTRPTLRLAGSALATGRASSSTRTPSPRRSATTGVAPLPQALADRRRAPDGLRPVDVSDYPDAGDLLLAADVLVTDYSSLSFDFASTGRPIVFFTPDLEGYRDEIRGFSIDFEADAPGPLLRTTDEVIEALRDLDAFRQAPAERYESFVARYCTLADGDASARVVERVFSW